MSATISQPYQTEKTAGFRFSNSASFMCDCNVPYDEREFVCPLELTLDTLRIPLVVYNRAHSRIIEIKALGAVRHIRCLSELCRDCLYNKTGEIR